MKYAPRPGVVKTQICGQTVLVPSRAASDSCKTLMPLTRLWAATWDAVTTGVPMESSVKVHCILTRRPEEEARASIERFCRALVEKGFLVELPDDAAEP